MLRRPRPHPVGPGQESVWDYPRPPRLDRTGEPVRVALDGVVIAESTAAVRVLETSHPPTHYVPPGDVDWRFVDQGPGASLCEWKCRAVYWTVRVEGTEVVGRAWSYPEPRPDFERLRDHLAFYPADFECWVGAARALPQPGGFYGGWVTPDVVGPFKGEPGTEWW